MGTGLMASGDLVKLGTLGSKLLGSSGPTDKTKWRYIYMLTHEPSLRGAKKLTMNELNNNLILGYFKVHISTVIRPLSEYLYTAEKGGLVLFIHINIHIYTYYTEKCVYLLKNFLGKTSHQSSGWRSPPPGAQWKMLQEGPGHGC